jgi:hypothetical protein
MERRPADSPGDDWLAGPKLADATVRLRSAGYGATALLAPRAKAGEGGNTNVADTSKTDVLQTIATR